MADHQLVQAPAIPFSLSHLIAVNARYKVLICLGNGCRCAIVPTGAARHLRDKHHEPIELRKQVERYLEQCQFHEYTYATVILPADGLVPQPIIPIVNGYQCKHCTHKSRNRREIREHANKVHDKKKIGDEKLFDLSPMHESTIRIVDLKCGTCTVFRGYSSFMYSSFRVGYPKLPQVSQNEVRTGRELDIYR
jgi:hypothetical protein